MESCRDCAVSPRRRQRKGRTGRPKLFHRKKREISEKRGALELSGRFDVAKSVNGGWRKLIVRKSCRLRRRARGKTCDGLQNELDLLGL